MSTPYLALGNQAFRERKYETAISFYKKALDSYSNLAPTIQKNIELAEKRLRPASTFSKAVGIQVDIVVPVYNALDDVKKCLTSLARYTDGFNVRVIVVNDGSEIDTSIWLREYCKENALFFLIEHENNRGYTKAVNAGLKASTGAYVITQNSDTVVSSGWLAGLVRCANSDAKIGIVGPLSNAASWQNVPDLYDPRTGGFAVNELPAGIDVEAMAEIVAKASTRSYPRVNFVNGFCFMIRRAVIDAIGYMDEINFPVGYGEENDFCIRAKDAGFELAVADDVYVFHAKSKSFGHERRQKLSKEGTENLKKKHSPEKYFSRVDGIKKTRELDEVRERVARRLRDGDALRVSMATMRIIFLLPVKGSGGGVHSVVQEAAEMRRLGVNVRVGVKEEHLSEFHKNYEDIESARNLFVGFNDINLSDFADRYDIVVATIFTSVELVKRVVACAPHILPAYYIQDYEPLFFDRGSEKWRQAFESYALINGAFLFAKTQWIIEQIKVHHGLEVHKVRPSIDHEVYKPAPRTMSAGMRLTAMIRPQTPRRGAERTMRLLSRLDKAFPGLLEFDLFGCPEESEDFARLQRDFRYKNHGVLKRLEVAALLGRADLFIDLSDYQAFGRTALEAMASGCASVVPLNGGADEYAIDGVNALVVDTTDEAATFEAVCRLLSDPDRLRQMQILGFDTASKYSVHSAAVSECVPLLGALIKHRLRCPVARKKTVALIPASQKDGSPTGSAYVRLLMPYRSPELRGRWKVTQCEELPQVGEADVVVLQRQVPKYSLNEIRQWAARWAQSGGKWILEIDDDLFEEQALIERGSTPEKAKEAVEKVKFMAGAASAVTVSASNLVGKLKVYNPNIFLIPNALDADLWELYRRRNHAEGPFARSSSVIRIGYIGTPTHDRDLDIVVDAMRKIEKKYRGRVEIEVIGGYEISLPKFGRRIGLPKRNDYPNFVKWLLKRVHWDIGIIPLANNEFNRSKSYLKFLEYSALDMAIVVSDAPVYASVARSEENCLIAGAETEEWISAVSRLMENDELRMRLAANAREQLIRHHTLSQNLAGILSALG